MAFLRGGAFIFPKIYAVSPRGGAFSKGAVCVGWHFCQGNLHGGDIFARAICVGGQGACVVSPLAKCVAGLEAIWLKTLP